VADTDTVHRLLLAQFGEHDIGVPASVLRRAVDAVFRDANLGLFLVARCGEDIGGLAAVSFAWTLEWGGRSAWLDELYVVPKHRGHGIGTALLRRAIEEARQAGCAGIDLEVDGEHARAGRLYAREGFHQLPRTRWARCLDEAAGGGVTECAS
jgi:GNAT superfamily N-acetyltransferase